VQLGRKVQNAAILAAIAVNKDGCREILGVAGDMKEEKAIWIRFFQWLCCHGLHGVKLIGRYAPRNVQEVVEEGFPGAKYQRCTMHFYRNVFSVVPRSKVKLVSKMFKRLSSFS